MVTKTTTVTVVEEKVVDRVVYRDVERVVYRDRNKTTTISKPDGTKIVIEDKTKETKTVADKTIEKEKTDEKRKSETTVTVLGLRRFTVGVIIPIGVSPTFTNTQFSVGSRLLNSPIFVELSVRPAALEFGVGVRVEI